MSSRSSDRRSDSRSYLVFLCLAVFLGFAPALLNFYVDPYELFFVRERSGKLGEVAEKAHYPLWKLSKYTTGFHETVILGDSRARALREKYWLSFGLKNTKNLAYGGGTIPEIYETFKLIKNDPAIKNLVIGIQLRSFDEDHKQGLNRVPEAVSLIRKPVDYLFNWTVAKTSFRLFEQEHQQVTSVLSNISQIVAPAFAKSPSNSQPAGADGRLVGQYAPVSELKTLPEKFRRQITRNARSDWRGFQFSELYWSYIEEIGRWASSEGKKVIFVIPPTIIQMQETIHAHNLSALNIDLRRKLSGLGIVLDFDIPDELSKNLKNFSDAYHFNAGVARQIVGEVSYVLSNDNLVKQRVVKRRKFIQCRFEHGLQFEMRLDEQLKLGLGKNCRVWNRTSS